MQRKVYDLFRHPAVGLAGTFLGIVSLAFAIWVYTSSKEYRHLAIYSSPERTEILSPNRPGDLRVLYKDEEITEESVTGVSIRIVNEGKLPIRADDILEPILVRFEVGTRILSVEVMERSREVTQFAIASSPEELAVGVLRVDWSILERHDGATLSVIIAGRSDSSVSAGGTVIGQSELTVGDPSGDANQKRFDLAQTILILMVVGLVGISAARNIVKKVLKDGLRDSALEAGRESSKMLWPLLVVALAIGGAVAVVYGLLWVVEAIF